jgi:hypothetical protein
MQGRVRPVESLAPLTRASPTLQVVVSSFALHLIDGSRLLTTLVQLALVAEFLLVLTPHKRPVIGEEMGWALVDEQRFDGIELGDNKRVRCRLYRSTFI